MSTKNKTSPRAPRNSRKPQDSTATAAKRSPVDSAVSGEIKRTKVRRVRLGDQIQEVNEENGRIVGATAAQPSNDAQDAPHVPQEVGTIEPWLTDADRAKLPPGTPPTATPGCRWALFYGGKRVRLTGDKTIPGRGKVKAQVILVELARELGIPLATDSLSPEATAAFNAEMTGASSIAGIIIPGSPEAKLREERTKYFTENYKKRFTWLEELAQDICGGHIPCAMCVGQAGSGKTWTIQHVIEKLNGIRVMDHIEAGELFMAGTLQEWEEEGIKYAVYFKGVATKLSMYKAFYLCQFSNAIILFDDADSIFQNQDTRNLLKAAMDSGKQRRITYYTTTELKDEESGMVFETRIKDFKGAIFIITNNDPVTMEEAIKSRLDGKQVSVFLTPSQMLERMEECMVGSEALSKYDIEVQKAALEFLRRDVNFKAYGNALSMRSLDPICNMIRRCGKTWKTEENTKKWEEAAEYALWQMWNRLTPEAQQRPVH